ncbi:serine carboxypeptidase S28-domain-containing protein [Xylariaceae sp. FL0804]|nr:serine carboxypeptidase S28-domain-containing protein [Xylariaceae sp. FL0804]
MKSTIFALTAALGACLSYASVQQTQGDLATRSSLYPPILNFTQTLCHDDPNDRETFQQRYQLDTSRFQPGGPILFHQSEEAAISPIEGHVFWDYAGDVHGIATTLEHRYFGESFPAGLDASSEITKETYAPLTLENILQDSAEYVDWIRRTVLGAENSPVIYCGGSYGGFLATMARIRHPETCERPLTLDPPQQVHGSIAASPVLRGFGRSTSLKDNPYLYAATDWLAQVYYDESLEASLKIKNALQELDVCAKASDCVTKIPDLNLCTPPTSRQGWESFLHDTVLNHYANIPQYSYGVPVTLPADALQVLVNATLAARSSGEVLRAPLLVESPSYTNASACLPSAAGDASTTIGKAFDYITATFAVLSEQATSARNPLLPASGNPPVVGSSRGAAWAGPMVNWTNGQTVEYYGLGDAALDAVERLLIVHGGLDRTTALGSPRLRSSGGGGGGAAQGRDVAREIVVDGLAHGESVLSELVEPRGVRTQLDWIRNTQLQYIKEWLRQTEASGSSPSGGGPSGGGPSGGSPSGSGGTNGTLANGTWTRSPPFFNA